MNCKTFSRLFLFVTLLTAGVSQGASVVSNLGNANESAWGLGGGSITLVDSPVANQFTTGAGPGWTLDSVTMSLGVFSGTPTGSISVVVAADDFGLPGSTIVTLSGADPTLSAENLSYTPDSPLQLAPGTSYWIVASADDSDLYQWSYTADTSESGLPGWSIGETSYAGFGVDGWTPLLDPFSNPANGPAPTQFEINASAVPEPSSAVLLLSALGAVLFQRRRTV